MGHRWFSVSRALLPSATQTRSRTTRALAELVALCVVAGVLFGSAPSALSQAESDTDESDDAIDAELPPLDLDLPDSVDDLDIDVDDLDLTPGGTPPATLPAGNRSAVRLSELIPNPELVHPDLPSGIVVDPRSLGPVASELNQARADLVDAQTRLQASQSVFALASLRLAAAEDALDAAVADKQDTEVARVEAIVDLQGFAVAAFISVEELGELTLSNDLDSMSLATLADEGEQHLTEELVTAVSADDLSGLTLDELRQERRVQRARRASSKADAETAQADMAVAVERIEILGPELETSILQLEVQGTDMPLVVLDAYYRAAENFRRDRPSCRVSWHQLAGIGRVESRHGTFRGSVVGRDGRTSNEILGPVLDGDPWLAIPDTDGGEYDLDTVWDRAVGPMQFIPGSWARHGQDGNGDGIIDPHNLYDAAMAAASHLCASAGDLDQRDNYQRALLGYNRSVSYGLLVMGYADDYLESLDLGPNL